MIKTFKINYDCRQANFKKVEAVELFIDELYVEYMDLCNTRALFFKSLQFISLLTRVKYSKVWIQDIGKNTFIYKIVFYVFHQYTFEDWSLFWWSQFTKFVYFRYATGGDTSNILYLNYVTLFMSSSWTHCSIKFSVNNLWWCMLNEFAVINTDAKVSKLFSDKVCVLFSNRLSI